MHVWRSGRLVQRSPLALGLHSTRVYGLLLMSQSDSQRWRLKLYRDDSETTVVFENVKHAFMTAGNTVLTIAQYEFDGSHHYINWPRERICWWRLERMGDG